MKFIEIKKSLLALLYAMNGMFIVAQTPVNSTDTIDNKVYTIVNPMPTFPDGEKARSQFIQERIKYPRIAIENGGYGNVYVGFRIQPDGQLTDIQIKRGATYPDIPIQDSVTHKVTYIKNPAIGSIEAECIRLVKLMPKWVNPSKKIVFYVFKISFHIE